MIDVDSPGFFGVSNLQKSTDIHYTCKIYVYSIYIIYIQ